MRRLAVPFGVSLALAAGSSAIPLAEQAVPPTAGVQPVTPADPAVLRQAFDLIRQGRTAEARALLEPVVAAHPAWGRARFHLALTWHEEHRYALARPEFERAIALDPAYRPAKLFYGWCLYYLGDLEQAHARFQAYLADRPDDADATFALGLIALDQDDAVGARTEFERAIALAREQSDAPVEAKAQIRLADALLRDGTPDARAAAQRALERAVELEPRRPEAWFKLSRVLSLAGRTEAARDAAAKSQALRAEAIRMGEKAGEEAEAAEGSVRERKPLE